MTPAQKATKKMTTSNKRAQADKLRLRVLRAISEHSSTCQELEDWLRLTHESCSPRLTDLRDSGLVRDTGTWRVTHSGRKATVWEITPAGKLVLGDE